jgi:peptide/nickel transport system substrate-binding protein
MTDRHRLRLLVVGAALAAALGSGLLAHRGGQTPAHPREELLTTDQPPGRSGGRLVVALRSEPKTLNPVTAADGPSFDVIGRMTADLIHINRESHLTEPALARSWSVSPDGRQYTIRLRRGIRFSDGDPLDADDVMFTFRVLLDEQVRAPQRDLLIVGGKPMTAEKLDDHTVRFTLASAYAAAERLFDGMAILPRHLLEPVYTAGQLATAWALASNRAEIAGLGPFRLKQYVPGERLVLERNPYYWKGDRSGHRLPYVDELVFVFVPSEDAQVLRFQSGDNHLLNRISAENFAVLERDQRASGYQLRDLGPGLEYNFLLFNLNDLTSKDRPAIAAAQRWFREAAFRRAVSLAIDREAIVRLAYQGRAAALWGNVSPGNRRWVNAALPHPARAPGEARALLRAAGFSYRGETLVDPAGQPVEFSMIVSASNAQRVKMATIIEDDLRQIGMRVHVVPLEFRALLDRVFQTWDYEACVLGLAGGDADPNPQINVLISRGTNHLWSLGQKGPQSEWEAEIDTLMERQLVTLDYRRRKQLYDRVQQLVAEHLPLVFLASPHVLVAARPDVGNFRPAILDHQTLWNVEELFLRSAAVSTR